MSSRKCKDILTAAANGKIEKVRNLLDEGVDVDTRDSDNRTILHWAARKGHADIVQLLLERGANAKLADNDYGNTPIHSASYKGHTDVVRMLLDHGVEPNTKNNIGTTALHYSWREPDITRLLLERGAIINQRDKYALHTLCKGDDNPELVVKVLKEYGIDVGAKNCPLDNDG